MMGGVRLVQPIVVRACGAHEDAVLAAARASRSAWTPETSAVFAEWLSGQHTKTVRRAKPAQFDRLVARFGVDAVRVGDAAAFALVPSAYEDFDAGVARLQVSGLVLPRAGDRPVDLGGAVLVVNSSLGMTTGKEAAQVAHGAWSAGTSDVSVVRCDAAAFARAAERADSVVVDSGLTELDGPTPTVAVFRRSGQFAISGA